MPAPRPVCMVNRAEHDMSEPGPLPFPPPTLSSRHLPTITVDTPQLRIHKCRWGALHFGTEPLGRFNAPDGAFGVLYLAADLYGAFVETFGRLGTKAELAPVEIGRAQLRASCTSHIGFTRPVALVDLTGPTLRRIGADSRLVAGDHERSRAWAAAIWAHPARPDGILYRSRLDPSRQNMALFSRASDALQAEPSLRLIDLPPAVIADLCDTYGFLYRAL